MPEPTQHNRTYPTSPWLTPDEREIGEWAVARPTPKTEPPTEFWRYVRDQIPTLLNTIAALRMAAGIEADREGLASDV